MDPGGVNSSKPRQPSGLGDVRVRLLLCGDDTLVLHLLVRSQSEQHLACPGRWLSFRSGGFLPQCLCGSGVHHHYYGANCTGCVHSSTWIHLRITQNLPTGHFCSGDVLCGHSSLLHPRYFLCHPVEKGLKERSTDPSINKEKAERRRHRIMC